MLPYNSVGGLVFNIITTRHSLLQSHQNYTIRKDIAPSPLILYRQLQIFLKQGGGLARNEGVVCREVGSKRMKVNCEGVVSRHWPVTCPENAKQLNEQNPKLALVSGCSPRPFSRSLRGFQESGASGAWKPAFQSWHGGTLLHSVPYAYCFPEDTLRAATPTFRMSTLCTSSIFINSICK